MEEKLDSFDILRPYNDAETARAMRRICKDRHFPIMAARLFPEVTLEDVRGLCASIDSADRFQEVITKPALKRMIFDSVTSYAYQGIEALDPQKSYLFISNHRDIVMDAVCLQYALMKTACKISQIAFGDNLLTSPLVTDLALSNRMFKVIRGGTPREFLQNSTILSHYIRHTIRQNQHSVWIAQRNGRTKDGFDLTEQGLLKMFNLSGTSAMQANFEELNLTPVAISYQFEPCDFLKVRERFLSKDQPYRKKVGEDFNSITTGISQAKGHTEIHIGKPLQAEELSQLIHSESNDSFKALAGWIDERIVGAYHLWNTNYIAYDQLHRTQRFADRYTSEERSMFLEYMHEKLHQIADISYDHAFEPMFLSLYANPVINKLRLDLAV